MQLELMTWPEVEAQLARGVCAMLPVGSVEQHGPMGLVGTDAICAAAVANEVASNVEAIVAPTFAYAPAPFNTAFPGTVSITPDLLTALVQQICQGLLDQGFLGVFIVNGHGANLEPIARAIAVLPPGTVKVQSWWAPQPVAKLRTELYADWEGMHATPSEVAITQALHGARSPGPAAQAPQKLTAEYIRAHSGDRHGHPDAHRAAFPDGRVGSHSALATPEDGKRLLDVAAEAIALEFSEFTAKRRVAAN